MELCFRHTTQIKRIGYYYQSYPDTTSFARRRNDDYIAAGFGFYLQITDAMQTPAEELYGCIINKKTYGIMTSVGDCVKDLTPSSYILYPAFPNPFNPSTIISYHLPKVSIVSLKVYDILGREIRTLVDEPQRAGMHTVNFNASGLSSGVYFYRLAAGHLVTQKSMLLLK